MRHPRVSALIPSPLGDLWAEATEFGLCRLSFLPPPVEQVFSNHAIFEALAHQLNNYWQGSLRNFSLPLDLQGSPFQKRVWQSLLLIPWGRTVSYKDQARALGDENAIRAVAAANGKNPVAVVVPCHRVIGSDGSLTGYAGGLERKRALLEREGWKPLGQEFLGL